MKLVHLAVYRQLSEGSAVRLAAAAHLVHFDYSRGTLAQHIDYAGRVCVARVAFALVAKEMASYEQRVDVRWRSMTVDQDAAESDELGEDIVRYQDSRKADGLMAAQPQRDEVRDGVMHTTIEQLMRRREEAELSPPPTA